MLEYWCLYDFSVDLIKNDASSGGASSVVPGRVNGSDGVGLDSLSACSKTEETAQELTEDQPRP